jgi:hypothetical protein
MAGLVIPRQNKKMQKGDNSSHTLNVIPKDLAMALSTTLSEALKGERNESITLLLMSTRERKYFSAFAASRHSVSRCW